MASLHIGRWGLLLLAVLSFSMVQAPLDSSAVGMSKEEFDVEILPLSEYRNNAKIEFDKEYPLRAEFKKRKYFEKEVNQRLEDIEDRYEEGEITDAEFIVAKTKLLMILPRAKAYRSALSHLYQDYTSHFKAFRNLDKLERDKYWMEQNWKKVDRTIDKLDAATKD